MHRAVRRVVVCAAALAALAGGSVLATGAAAVPPPVSAARTTPVDGVGLAVTLAQVSPQVASPSTDVTVQVAVHNTGTTAVKDLTARAELRSTRFTKRGAIGDWLAADGADDNAGLLLSSAVGQPLSQQLDPGDSTTLSVTIPRDRWRLGRPFAVVPVQVVVTGTRSGTAVASTTRTTVPWTDATQSYVPLGLAWTVPLTLPADPALFADDPKRALTAWQHAMGPESAVRGRLDAAGAAPVTWLVDPALFDARDHVKNTPTAPAPTATAAPSPQATPHPAVDLTTGLVDALKKLPSTQNVWALPPSDPDTAALTATGLDPAVTKRLYPDRATGLDEALGATAPRAVAWPSDGVWSTARNNAFHSMAGSYPLSAALVSTSSIASPKGYTAGAAYRSADGTGLLAYDDELSGIAGGTADHAKGLPAAQVVQTFLSESLVLLGEREGTPRDAVVALPRDATTDPATLRDLLRAAGTAPWLRSTTVPAVAARLSDARQATTVPPTARAASPLTPSEVRRDETRSSELRGIDGILPAVEGHREDLGRVGDELFSARWRQSPAAYGALTRQVDARIAATRNGVQVSPANINFLTDAGAVAITVTNDLPYPVSNVRLKLVPGNGRLRVDHQPEPVSIQAHSRATVRVDVTALGSGAVPVVARVVTPSGTQLGTPRTVTMNVRPPSEWILWVAGGVLLLVLVAGLARALTRQPTRAVRDDLVVPPADTATAPDHTQDDRPSPGAPETHPRGDR